MVLFAVIRICQMLPACQQKDVSPAWSGDMIRSQIIEPTNGVYTYSNPVSLLPAVQLVSIVLRYEYTLSYGEICVSVKDNTDCGSMEYDRCCYEHSQMTKATNSGTIVSKKSERYEPSRWREGPCRRN